MKKKILYILILQAFFISCVYNPCEEEIPAGKLVDRPFIYSVSFSPEKAERGDTVTVTIKKDNWNIIRDLDFNKDYKITDEGKIKYVGSDSPNHCLINGKEIEPITGILQVTDNEEARIEVTEKVTEYVSISSESVNDFFCEDCVYNSCTSGRRPYDYDELKEYYPGYELVTISFKVPANAKSGYIRTTTPDHFAEWGISAKKLIIVDDDGNEIK